MATLLVYLATTSDAWTASGTQLFVDLDTPVLFDPGTLELRRFTIAAAAAPQAEIVVVFTDEPPADDTAGEAGSVRLQRLFHAWSDRNGRAVACEVLPSTSHYEQLFRRQSDLFDGWLDRYAAIDLYLGGENSVADALAWLSSLDGHQVPASVRLHTFRRTRNGDQVARELLVRTTLNAELTREHARHRIERWEFVEADALAELHRELGDVGELLDASSRFLQRNDEPLARLDLLDPQNAVPTHHVWTGDVCHAIEIAEHLTTVGRREEETAWCILLAFSELAPAAWLEGESPPIGGHRHVTVAAMIEAASIALPNFRELADKLLGARRERVYDGETADAARLLALLGAGTDAAVAALTDGGVAPSNPGAVFALWLALREGLRAHRNELAHFLHDLNEVTLVDNVLRPAARDAARHLHTVFETPSAPPAGPSVAIDQALRHLRGEPPTTPERPGSPGAARLWRQAFDARATIDAETAGAMLSTILSLLNAPTSPTATATAIAAARRLADCGHQGVVSEALEAAKQKQESKRATIRCSPAQRDAILVDLHDSALIPRRLDCPDDIGLRALLAWFVPHERQRQHPLVAVRARLLEALDILPS